MKVNSKNNSSLNLDWRFISYMILYMFQCHSPKSSHPCPLPQSAKDYSIHLCLFCCPAYRVIITIFMIFIIVKRNFLYNSLYIPTERSLKHICSIRAWIPMSFSLSFSLSVSYCQLWTARFWSIKGSQHPAIFKTS